MVAKNIVAEVKLRPSYLQYMYCDTKRVKFCSGSLKHELEVTVLR